MTQFTRRKLFATAAAAGVATTTPSLFGIGGPAKAAAPISGKQAPGVYRFKVGDLEVTQLTDGARTFPMPDNFVVNVSKDQAIAAAAAAYMPNGQVTIPFTPTLINTGSKLVLIDTGNGEAANAATKGAAGQMLSNLKAAGIDPKSIDIVVISHFHGDHINGLRMADNSLAFPNAEIKVPDAEWAFWMNPENEAKATGFSKGQFAAPKKVFDGLADKVTKYDGGKEVAPGITAIATPGHTPGHMSFAVASGSAKYLIQSDVTTIPSLFLANPEWSVVFDNDAAQAVATRKKFFEMAASEKMMVHGYHFPFPAVGYVEKNGPGYRLVPVAWNPSL